MTAHRKTLTTSSGAAVPDNQNALTAGPRGPLLVQDHQLFEKHAHFNRERIPERVVHAVGSAAHGTLTITHDITKYSRAKVYKEANKRSFRQAAEYQEGRKVRNSRQARAMAKGVPGVSSALAERLTGGRYIDVDIDRKAAARYGLNIADVQSIVAGAIGGENVGETIEGLARYRRDRFRGEHLDRAGDASDGASPFHRFGQRGYQSSSRWKVSTPLRSAR